MGRLLIAALVLATVAVGCTEKRQPLAPEGPRFDLTSSPACDPGVASRIRAQITALFPSPGLRQSANSQFNNVDRECTTDRQDAQAKALDLADFTTTKFHQGKLLSAATASSVAAFVNDLLSFVGIPSQIPAAALTPEGAVQLVGPTGGQVVNQLQTGGVDIPANVLPGNALVVIAPLPSEPFSAERGQFPPFFDVSTLPAVQLNGHVVVGVCVVDPPNPSAPDPAFVTQLRLAHPSPDGGLDILPKAPAPFLNCPPALGSSGTNPLGFASRMLKRVGSLFSPEPLFAATSAVAPGGLGGLAGSFSPFGTVAVVGVCGGGPVEDFDTYPDFAQAFAAVAPSGTIRACSGTFPVTNLVLDAPVTIEPQPGNAPVIQTTGGPDDDGFRVNGVDAGTVSFLKLAFVNTTGGSSVAATGTYDTVRVDGSQFSMPSGDGAGVFGGSSTVAGAAVLVTKSSFNGGSVGVFASGAPQFDVSNSMFANFSFSGIQYQLQHRGLIEANTVSDCGFAGCIRVRLTDGVTILNNTVNVASARNVRWGIVADTGPNLVIQGNVVMGIGTVADPNDPASYAITTAGIGVGLNGVSPGTPFTTTVSGNKVTNARAGIEATNASTISGSDNVIDVVYQGISGVPTLARPSITINRSDITRYVVPFTGRGLTDLTCNWWGSAAGPLNIPSVASVYTPWAVAPIANGAGGSCTGAPAAPTHIDVNNFVIDLRRGMIANASNLFNGGFYKEVGVLYAAGFVYATSPNDILVGYNTSNGASDFDVTSPLGGTTDHTTADLRSAGLTGVGGVTVTQESFAFSTDPDRDYVLLKYTLTNTGGGAVGNVFAGLVADLDLLYSGNPFDDVTSYNAGLSASEVTEANVAAFPQVIGIVPIASGGTPLNYTPFQNPGGAPPGVPTDPPTRAGYFPLLSSGLVFTSPFGPADIRQAVGFGPFSIPAGGSQVVWFALVGGDDSNAFAANVAAARAKVAALQSP